jgi:hypothetical protein
MDAVDRGEYVSGGSFFLSGQPDWKCTSCGYAWFDVDDPIRIKRDKTFNDLINDPPGEDTDEPT